MLEQGNLCILSTGSYYDGAVGFVDALIEEGLLPGDALEKLVISGALVDWRNRTVIHANIADNKIKGLEGACLAKGCTFVKENVVGIYVDDPEGNDSGICSLNPGVVRLISTVCNQGKQCGGFKHTDWATVNAHALPG